MPKQPLRTMKTTASRALNRGPKVGPQKALKAEETRRIRFELSHRGDRRDRALFDLAIGDKLRGCDPVKLRIGDVVSGGQVRHRVTVVEQRTDRPVRFEITETARESVPTWLDERGGALDDFLFTSRLHASQHMSTGQYARLPHALVSAIGLNSEGCSAHPLRRTKAALIDKRTGGLRAAQILLCRTKIESTVRHLGVDVEDALALSQDKEI